ncbi:hypothetical protein OV320_6946 [Actinobacteria bacterium OV320]|nr:hypothetical protein OV320_6946 [Actinobacteria bacterium OV320]
MNGWTMAGRAGHATLHRIQVVLGEASWSADALLAEIQAYVARELGDRDATLVLDDTQVIKKGDEGVGGAYQHCRAIGDVRNCQVMGMLNDWRKFRVSSQAGGSRYGPCHVWCTSSWAPCACAG